jgi:hypothetical protein
MIEKIKSVFFPCQENKYKPKFLETRVLVYYLIFLFLLKILLIPFFIYFPKSIFFAEITNNAIIEFTNQKRKLFGAPLLKENPNLDQAAYLKAQDMLQKGYFSHNSPDGISPWYWFKKTGYDFKLAGENLAIGFLDSEEVIDGWYASPSHRANLLNPNYQDIGIAVLKGNFQGNETTLVVQLFGAQKAPTGKLENKGEKIAKEKGEPLVKKIEPPAKKVETPEVKTEAKVEKVEPVEGKLLMGETKPKDLKGKAEFQFFNFLSLKYHKLIQAIIYLSLIFVIGSLLIAIFFDIFVYRKFILDYKDLIPKAIGFTILLIVFLLIDKPELISFIPHNFQIF